MIAELHLPGNSIVLARGKLLQIKGHECYDSKKEYLFDDLKSTCKVLRFKVSKCVVDETDNKSLFFAFSLQLLLISFP